MKYKTASRILGLAEAGMFGYLDYSIIHNQYDSFTKILNDPSIPNELKIIYGVLGPGINTVFLAASAFGTIDGIASIVKGCQFYLSLKTWSKITKSEKTREKIKSELESILNAREKTIKLHPAK